MSYSPRVKGLAYTIDPDCWLSYSGRSPTWKRAMDARRLLSLKTAAGCILHGVHPDGIIATSKWLKEIQEARTMTPMKIDMMLHFYAVAQPYHNRNCSAYDAILRELIIENMIEKVNPNDATPGLEWVASARGKVYVEALTKVPLPVRAEAPWVMPK